MMVIICVLQKEFHMEIGAREPVLEIKKRIEQFLGVPTASQTLMVFDWELVNGLDMEDYPIVSDDTKIDLSIDNTKISIIVKISSRQHIIDVATMSETVRNLKEKIHILDGMPIDKISLFISGTELGDENRCLSEYGIILGLTEVTVVRKIPCHDRPKMISLTVSLLGGAGIPVQASPSNTVSDLRRSILARKVLPMDDYLFVYKQKIMREDLSLNCHGVEDGDFLFVFKGTVSPGEF